MKIKTLEMLKMGVVGGGGTQMVVNVKSMYLKDSLHLELSFDLPSVNEYK